MGVKRLVNSRKFYTVDKKTLITIAGIVWCIAGFNVDRLGLMAYGNIKPVNLLYPVLSLAVFAAFGIMFFNMSRKHVGRILGSVEEFRPFWTFFDIRSYLIMIFMMTGGIWLRASHLVPESFIAFFYTGLGSALTLAGISFLYRLFNLRRQ